MSRDDVHGTNNVPLPQAKPYTSPPGDGTPAPTTVELVVAGVPQRVRLRLNQPSLVLGRADNGDSTGVDVDLTPFGAFQHGVSRQHVRLVCQQDGLFVQDMGSTNGTRINGYRLERGRAYRLRSGDELELGRLRVMMLFMGER